MEDHIDDLEGINYADNGRKIRDDGNDLEDMGNSTIEVINLQTVYQRHWGPQEGFRELFQNWKDGIMRSFNIAESDFEVESEDRPGQKYYAVYHPISKALLGYIRFEYDKDELGTLEITNFRAALKRRDLGIGGDSKFGDSKQLGQHGEGLKLSALVYRRHPHNHNFRVYSTGCKWTFGWDIKKRLSCRIQRILGNKLKEAKEIAAEQDEDGEPREAKARVWEDVSIIIGEAVRCRSMKGDNITTSKIPLQEFNKWLAMTIDIDGPRNIVRTESGDLILEPAFRNKIYLHGLLLPNGSRSGRSFEYGYNLLYTATNRDREAINDASVEARTIANIWRDALIQESVKKEPKELVEMYSHLLCDYMETAADVFSADKFIADKIVELVWDFLKTRKIDGKLPFYHSGSSSSQGAIIFSRSLNREPVCMSNGLWNIFHRRDLCNTVREEQLRLFKKAESSQLPNTLFAKHVMKALKGLLDLDPITAKAKIIPVNGEDLDVIVNYNNGEWKIDNKWFVQQKAHRLACCEAHYEEKDDDSSPYVFSCDHVVLWIYDNMISVLQGRRNFNINQEKEALLKSTARVKLQQMPRGITLKADPAKNGLEVTWVTMEPPSKSIMPLKVILHSSTCSLGPGREEETLYDVKSCHSGTCHSITTTVGSGSVSFSFLSGLTPYFPVVFRDTESAIAGVAPKPVTYSDPNLPAISVPTPVRKSAPRNNRLDMTPVTAAEVAKLFDQKASNENWKTVSHQDLFKDWFPYAHDWLQSVDSNNQIYIANPNPNTTLGNLKRVQGDDLSEGSNKRAKN